MNMTKGMLKTSPGISNAQGVTNRTYLPLSNDTCSLASNYKCFMAGDHRSSQNLGIFNYCK